MKRVVVLAWDSPGSAEPRERLLDEHFAHIASIVERISVAGPLKDTGGANIGSLFVLDVSDADEAERLFKSDPYFAAGVWERWQVLPFLAAAGEWVGGTIW